MAETNLARWLKMDIFPNPTNLRNEEWLADKKVRANFFKGRSSQMGKVLPYGLKNKSNQMTGIRGDSSDHIRMVKIFSRMKFNDASIAAKAAKAAEEAAKADEEEEEDEEGGEADHEQFLKEQEAEHDQFLKDQEAEEAQFLKEQEADEAQFLKEQEADDEA
jgi:hypothetical protein